MEMDVILIIFGVFGLIISWCMDGGSDPFYRKGGPWDQIQEERKKAKEEKQP